MKKGIIFGIGFAAGVGVGFLANAVIKKINEKFKKRHFKN